MSGLFGTLNIGSSGLNAQQAAINTTSHNISNASTPGYTRQRVNLTAGTPQNSISSAGQIGTGVQVASITRVTDDFLDYQTRTQNSVQGTYTAKDQVLSQVETIINEPSDTGLSTLLGNFYTSFAQLAQNPSDAGAKQLVASQSLELTDGLNSTYNQLTQLKTDTNGQINSTVTDVNSILTQLNAVNKSIVQVSLTGQQPNDLMDTRDNLLNQLSSDLGVNVTKEANNGITVTTTIADGSTNGSTINLVQYPGIDTTPSLSYNSGTDTYTATYGPAASTTTSTLIMTDGALNGYSLANADVDTDISQLNNVAKGFALSVNAIETQSSSYQVDGTPASTTDKVGSYNMFVNASVASADYNDTAENAITAGNITLNSQILNDSSKIISGLTNDPTISGVDDGTRALAIANLQNTSLNIQGITDTTTREDFLSDLFTSSSTQVNTVISSPSGVTTDSYYNSLVDNIGIKEQQAQTMMANQTTLLASYATSKASVSGVSLDEEMSNLIQYQHGYQANAKVISTIDQLLDVVINGLMSS